MAGPLWSPKLIRKVEQFTIFLQGLYFGVDIDGFGKPVTDKRSFKSPPIETFVITKVRYKTSKNHTTLSNQFGAGTIKHDVPTLDIRIGKRASYQNPINQFNQLLFQNPEGEIEVNIEIPPQSDIDFEAFTYDYELFGGAPPQEGEAAYVGEVTIEGLRWKRTRIRA